MYFKLYNILSIELVNYMIQYTIYINNNNNIYSLHDGLMGYFTQHRYLHSS